MRIIAGSAKGVTLVPPTDRSVRPTLDRVREACFSIIGPTLEGARFLDLYAGTGANALEALSRGAAHADLVELDKDARRIIEQNIVRTKFVDRARVHGAALPAGLARLANGEPYDIIYADPPHAFSDYDSLLGAIHASQLLAPDGLVILEHSSRTLVPEALGGLNRLRQAVYGETTLSFYRAAEVS